MKSLKILMAAITLAVASTAALAKTNGVHSAASIECSKQADAKGLHGAERKKFRAQCKKDLKAKASTTSSGAPPASTAPKTETPSSTKKY